MLTVATADQPVAVPKPSKEARKAASRAAAIAVLGGRFADVKAALDHPDFAIATKYYTYDAWNHMKEQPEAIAAAQAAEKERRAAGQVAVMFAVQPVQQGELQHSSDTAHVETRFKELVDLAQAGIPQTSDEQQMWRQLFSKTDAARLRQMAFLFQAGAWSGEVERTPLGKQPRGMEKITAQAHGIFGDKAAWCSKAIAKAVKSGREDGTDTHDRRSFPKEIEDKLVLFITRLRELKVPVYKDTVLGYAMGLLETHVARLNFAKVDTNGEYIYQEGCLVWDKMKLSNWYHRRLIGDRPDLFTGACFPLAAAVVCSFLLGFLNSRRTEFDSPLLSLCRYSGNQRLLDSARAKWGTAKNMRVHYDNVIARCVANGICYPNPLYDPQDLDDKGVPNQPEVLFHAGQQYRLISFDEMRCEDKTHGDGGDRKGRCERTMKCGKDDDGECVGSRHASKSASVVGGSNAAGEALPCFVVTASSSFQPEWCADGPTTTINGQIIGMDGDCNTKGAVQDGRLRRGVLASSAGHMRGLRLQKSGNIVGSGVLGTAGDMVASWGRGGTPECDLTRSGMRGLTVAECL